MNEVFILGARLSSNPETLIVKHEQGLNGMVNSTTTGKLFYVVDATVFDGARPVTKSIMIWADVNNRFDLSVAKYNAIMTDKIVTGKLVRFDDVPPYTIGNKPTVFTHVKLLVLENEVASDVLAKFLEKQATREENAGDGVVPPAKATA